MNDGWVTTISQLYRKKDVKRQSSSFPSQITYSSNRKEVTIVDRSYVQKVKRNSVAPQTDIHRGNLKSCHCGNCQVHETNQNRDEMVSFVIDLIQKISPREKER